jgi:putative addiction module CopG family antidote
MKNLKPSWGKAGNRPSLELRDRNPYIRYRRKRSPEGKTAMEVQLTDDQKAFVRQAIQSGRYKREEDALQDAMNLWEGRERRRAEILAAVDQAEASYARGEGRRITTLEESANLAEDIKRRGLARLTAEEKRPL